MNGKIYRCFIITTHILLANNVNIIATFLKIVLQSVHTFLGHIFKYTRRKLHITDLSWVQNVRCRAKSKMVRIERDG